MHNRNPNRLFTRLLFLYYFDSNDCFVNDTFHDISKFQESFSGDDITEFSFSLAKKRTLYKLLKRFDSDTKKDLSVFLEEILWTHESQIILQGIHFMEMKDLYEARTAIVKDYLNPKKLNMVVMLSKSNLTQFKTLKSLASHGFKLFF